MIPVLPAEVKATIPSPSGSFCSKFLAVLQLPTLVYRAVAWAFNEDGSFSDDLIADLCAVKCSCSGGTPPPDNGDLGGPVAPTNIQASDGLYSSKIAVTWNSVVAATSYQVYRSDMNDFTAATVIGTTTGNLATSFDDNTAVPGQTYYYWVRGLNGALRGVVSSPDSGYAVAALTAVTGLLASRGFYGSSATTGIVSLVFAPVASPVNAYDIYRGTVDDFAAATTSKIDSDRVPFDNARSTSLCSPTPCTKPLFVDCGGELVYQDKPPDKFLKYFYWVIAKQITEGRTVGVSAASTSAFGWVSGDGASGAGAFSDDFLSIGAGTPIPSGVIKAWVVLRGPSASGAGGDATFGGGGGGGSAIVAGLFAMTAGPNRFFRYVASATAGGAPATNGGDSPVGLLQYDPGTGVFATILSTSAAGKGIAGSGGAGGAGSAGTVVGALTATQTEPGRAGKAAVGDKGGRGGSSFGKFRSAPNHLNGNLLSNTGALQSGGGGGSDALPSVPGSADGADGNVGGCIIKNY